MKFELKSSSKILILNELCKIVKNSYSYICFEFRENGLYIQTMDDSHICLSDILFEREWFDLYDDSRDENGDNLMNVQAAIFIKVLSLQMPNTTLVISANDKNDKMTITLSTSNDVKSFEIPLMDIEKDGLEPGENDYDCDFKINTKLMDKYMNELMIFGDVIQLSCKNDNLYLQADGINGNMKIKIPHDNLVDLCAEEGAVVKSKFDIKYISFITKCSQIFKNINISFDNQFPLYINIDEDNVKVKYYIAPKTNDDDEDDVDSDDENIIVDTADIED